MIDLGYQSALYDYAWIAVVTTLVVLLVVHRRRKRRAGRHERSRKNALMSPASSSGTSIAGK